MNGGGFDKRRGGSNKIILLWLRDNEKKANKVTDTWLLNAKTSNNNSNILWSDIIGAEDSLVSFTEASVRKTRFQEIHR